MDYFIKRLGILFRPHDATWYCYDVCGILHINFSLNEKIWNNFKAQICSCSCVHKLNVGEMQAKNF